MPSTYGDEPLPLVVMQPYQCRWLATVQNEDFPKYKVRRTCSRDRHPLRVKTGNAVRQKTENDVDQELSMLIESIVQPVSHHLGPDDSLLTAASLLEAAEITALTVTNDDGTLLGLITAEDVVAAIEVASDSAAARVIAEIVRPGVLTCTVSAEVKSLANQARIQNLTHVLVVDDLDSLVGIADLSPYQGSSREIQYREAALREASDGTQTS